MRPAIATSRSARSSVAAEVRRSAWVRRGFGWALATPMACLVVPTGAAAQDASSLFNGRDLEGWTVHGTELWYVEDGELVCESGPDAEYGYLATVGTYDDFDLTLEFLQEADGNSGVFFRSTIDGTRISGWQAEVAPPGLFTGGIYESYGRGWLVQPDPAKDGVLRMGEWNALRLRVVGSRVTTWLNGVPMVDLVDDEIGRGEGHIALQIHSGGGIKVRWRNLRLRQLGAPGGASHETALRATR